MAHQFVQRLEELSIHEGAVKEIEGLIQRFNLNMSSLKKQAARMYKNNIESFRESGDCNKNPQEKLCNIKTERYYFKKYKVTNT